MKKLFLFVSMFVISCSAGGSKEEVKQFADGEDLEQVAMVVVDGDAMVADSIAQECCDGTKCEKCPCKQTKSGKWLCKDKKCKCKDGQCHCKDKGKKCKCKDGKENCKCKHKKAKSANKGKSTE